jgi:SAM-dependent methyltransferase
MFKRGLYRRIKALEARQEALEKLIGLLQPGPASQPSDQAVANVLKNLGARTVSQNPNINYFNERFRNYELSLLNIKNLGYYLGHQLYRVNGPSNVAGPHRVALSSRMCTQQDVESEWFAFWCEEMRSAPRYHRKLWELAFIAQALYSEGTLAPGSNGLGFGCGQEPLPALFAKYGARILATDLDPSRPESAAWRNTNQHSADLSALRRRDVCDDDRKLLNIELRYVDMNDIPPDLHGRFDFCWSACAFEHLGSIAKGLDFVENSLRTLKPGGVAVHTTEMNLAEGETIDHWGTVLYQRHHFLELAERLHRKGHHVSNLDFDPGSGVLDGFVDVPPFGADGTPLKALQESPHLKLSVDGFICTSFGIIVRTGE